MKLFKYDCFVYNNKSILKMRQQKYTNPAFKQYEIQSKNVNDIVFHQNNLIR